MANDYNSYDDVDDDDLWMLRVILFDSETSNIQDHLGMAEDRGKELDELVKKSYFSTDTLTNAMKEISENVNHANELAYCCFHLGAIHSKIMSDPIGRIFADTEREKYQKASGKEDKELTFEEEKKSEEDDLVFDD